MSEELENNGAEEAGISAALEGGDGSAEFAGESMPAKGGMNKFLLVGLLAAGVGAFFYFKGKSGPAPAAAATPSAVAANSAIRDFLSNGTKSVKAMQDLLKNTEKVVEQFDAFPSQSQVPLSDLRTNPFRFAAPPAPAQADNGELARRQLEEQRKVVLAAVQKLKLQSILYSPSSRTCIINNEVYSEGQKMGELTVETITADAVIIRGGQWRFEVKIKR